jgi:drug/metabolite transporter (DMT)-like permease
MNWPRRFDRKHLATFTAVLAGAPLLTPWLPGALGPLARAPHRTRPPVLVLGVFPAVPGYATWTFTLGYFGAARPANFLYLTPIVPTALLTWLTGERPGIATLYGGLTAIAGAAFVASCGRQ